MPSIVNYTTQVPAVRTAAEIQALLVKAGASRMTVDYEGGRATGLDFIIGTAVGPRRFVLPVNVGPVEAVLRKDGVERRYRSFEHAERVAWRILKDWLEAQLALVRIGMAEFDQVMLPYMTGDNGVTVYELYRGQTLALPPGSEA